MDPATPAVGASLRGGSYGRYIQVPSPYTRDFTVTYKAGPRALPKASAAVLGPLRLHLACSFFGEVGQVDPGAGGSPPYVGVLQPRPTSIGLSLGGKSYKYF